nr:HAMP domain-containing histidine kinase [Lachnospiraceae bacterium]
MNKTGKQIVRVATIFLALLLGLIFLIYSWLAYPFITRARVQEVEEVYCIFQEEDLEDLLQEIEDEEFEFEQKNVHFILCDDEFRLIFSSNARKGDKAVNVKIKSRKEKYAENAKAEVIKNKAGDIAVVRGMLNDQGEVYYIYVYSNLKNARTNVIYSQYVMGISFVLGLLLFWLFMSVVVKKMMRPVSDLRTVTEKLDKGEYDARILQKMPDNEIGEIAEDVNGLAEVLYYKNTVINNYKYLLKNQNIDLAETDVLQKRMVSNVTHHLKTPLAIISSQIELELEEKDEERKRYYYDSIMEEIEKMSSQISELLRKSKEEQQAPIKIKVRRVNVSEWLMGLVLKYESWYAVKGIRLVTEIEQDLYANIDPMQMEQAINNYMMNACSHTKKGGMVALRLRKEGEEVLFEVYNEGGCIPESDMENIWKDYYRRATVEGNDGANIGLGLYIVKDIVRQHGGNCGGRNEDKGVTFWIRLTQ